jgi:hypothetical protein
MDSLSKNIRKNLSEIRTIKKQRIAESNIVKNRFEKILDNSYNRTDFFLKSISEMKKLYSYGFEFNILKENLMDLLGVLFDGESKDALIDNFKSEGADHLINKLNLEVGQSLEKAIRKVFEEQESENSMKLFSDCDFLCEEISKCLVEEMGINNQSQENSMIKSIKSELKISICPIIDSLDTKMSDGFSGMKSKILSV